MKYFRDEKAKLIFGVLKDKNASEIYRTLSTIADSVLLPAFAANAQCRQTNSHKLLHAVTPDKECAICASCADAIRQVRSQLHRVLITGSLHFAGEMLAILRGEPAA